MRIGFIGVSHWHAPFYYRPVARMSGVRIVAVSDLDPAVADSAGRELGARPFRDYRELISEARPDFVFAFGRHCDLAEIGTALIDSGIPCVIEKPAGLNFQQVSALRDRADVKGIHVGTGFNFRVSDLYRKIQAIVKEEPMTHASFRWIGGGPYRYLEAGCPWMLDPQLSGGGCTINLSVHFMDMFRQFSGGRPTEVASMMGHQTWNLRIEDYSSVILRSPSAVCAIETGYTYPAQSGIFDLRFSVRTSRHYIIARSDNVLEIHRICDGHLEQIATPTSNVPWYPLFATESIDRFAKGQPPIADLNDLADVIEMVDAAYASDRGGGSKIVLRDR